MSRVVINEAGVRHLFSNPRGPVARLIDQHAEEIFQQARVNILVGFDERTGDLDASLHKVHFTGPDGFYHVAVGADAEHRGFPYAKALETGINPFTGADMAFKEDKAYMVPAVQQAGFRRRA